MTGRLHTLFFSPTGGTGKVVGAVAAGFGAGAVAHDLTLPRGREQDLAFDPRDVAVIGAPVHAGRVPLAAAQGLARVQGHGAAAVLVGVYGNRAFEDALLELRDLCLGRLCAYLRQREPDDEVGYSILIYHLSDAQVREALEGPPAELRPGPPELLWDQEQPRQFAAFLKGVESHLEPARE